MTLPKKNKYCLILCVTNICLLIIMFNQNQIREMEDKQFDRLKNTKYTPCYFFF